VIEPRRPSLRTQTVVTPTTLTMIQEVEENDQIEAESEEEAIESMKEEIARIWRETVERQRLKEEEAERKKRWKMKRERLRANKSRYGVDIEGLLADDIGYKQIATKVFKAVMRADGAKYQMDKAMDDLFSVSEDLQDDVFLSVVLEFVSLVKERYSILSVIEHIKDSNIVDADGHFATLMEIEGALSVFRDYELLCLVPQSTERMTQIEALMAGEATASEFVASGCGQYPNYKTMRLMLEYAVKSWLKERDPVWLQLVEQMVTDADDWDNNDKLLFLSYITSIFDELGFLRTSYLEFVRECVSADILSLRVLDNWRMDEFDGLTSGKKEALIVLSDLIHQLQNKEIKDSEQALYSHTTDEEDFADLVDGYRCIGNYIGSDSILLPINSNRINVHHRCPWKAAI